MFRYVGPGQSPPGRPIERREFLKGISVLGALAFLVALVPSCLRPTEPAAEPAGGTTVSPSVTATPDTATAAAVAEETPATTPAAVAEETPATTPAAVAEETPTTTAAAVAEETPTTRAAPATTAEDASAATPAPAAKATPRPSPGVPYLAVARGESPTAMVQAALKALGGIERFVKPGNDVIIKPNIVTAYHSYEYATTTNPEVMGALVQLCLAAGAKRVRAMDRPFGGTPTVAYNRGGIAEAVTAAGGEMEVMVQMKYRDTEIPQGRDIKVWPVYGAILDTDVLINVPIAKDHYLARLTLGMKNLMGVIRNRNQFHRNLGQRIADLNTVVRPTLTVVDAVRILVDHGPGGGSLKDVKLTNTVIASHDIVAADAYAATLFGLTGADIPATRAGAEMGLGTMDLGSLKVEEINV